MTSSSLEQFPDELLLEIFRYLPLHDLYHSFSKLNQRINDILHSVTGLSLILNKSEDINDEAVCFFASNIYHLTVRHCNPVHFHRFPSLRSLTSLCPQDRQLRSIKTKDLPNLTHLTVDFSLIWDCELMERLCQRIVTNKFPKLRYCSLWPPGFDKDYIGIPTPALTKVELKEGNLDDLCVVLNSCPNLKYLQMLVSIYAVAPSKPIRNFSVQRLDISFIPYDPDWIDKLDHLLSLVPNIQRLFLKICVLRIDFAPLSRIFRERIVHLSSLRCEIHAIEIPIQLKHIQQYHPLFDQIDLQDLDDSECQCDGLKLCVNGKRKN